MNAKLTQAQLIADKAYATGNTAFASKSAALAAATRYLLGQGFTKYSADFNAKMIVAGCARRSA